MAISAKRFNFLDKETNLPVSDFITASSSDILNGGQVDLFNVTNQLQALVSGNNIGGIASLLKKVNGSSGLGLSRLTKDFYSSKTLMLFDTKPMVDAAADAMFPNNPLMQNIFGQIGTKCRATILAGLSNCKNKKKYAKFNGKRYHTSNRSCNASSFANLINKLTGGLYIPDLLDQCALSKLIAGVAIRGIEIGLPGVFSALSSQIEDKHLLAQTGLIVMGSASQQGLINGVMDVAGSSIGPMLPMMDPGISSRVMNNFSIPSEIKQGQYSDFFANFDGAMSNMDPNWATAVLPDGNIPSMENIDPNNEDVANLFQCSAYDVDPELTDDDGDVPEPSQSQYLSAAINLGPSEGSSSIGSDFGYLPLVGNDTSDAYNDYV